MANYVRMHKHTLVAGKMECFLDILDLFHVSIWYKGQREWTGIWRPAQKEN